MKGRTIAQEIRTHAWTADGEPVDVVTILALASNRHALLRLMPDLRNWDRRPALLPCPIVIWTPPTGIIRPAEPRVACTDAST